MADGGDNSAGIEVAKSVVATQAKAQLRVALGMLAGVIAGSAFGHRFLPPGLFSEPVLDALSALIVYGIASRWTWVRAKVVHSRFWSLATNPEVPNDVIRPK